MEKSGASALGKVLQRRREARGWTTYRLAQKAGVSNPYITSLEQGRGSRVGIIILTRLAQALDVSVGELLEDAGLAEPSEPTPSLDVVLRRSSTLSEQEIQAVKHYVEALEASRELKRLLEQGENAHDAAVEGD